jgi:hypothetical protein
MRRDETFSQEDGSATESRTCAKPETRDASGPNHRRGTGTGSAIRFAGAVVRRASMMYFFSRSFRSTRLVLLAAALAVGAGPRALAAMAGELGRPVLRHYAPGEHLRALSSPRVFQDPAGFMYFANNGDLLTFDGLRWGFLKLPTESAAIRQFTLDADGTIFMAGAGALGYLRGRGPTATYVSLVGELPAAARNVDEMSGALAIGRTVYFSDDEKILVWRDGRLTVIPWASPAHGHGARLHRVGSTPFVTALGRGLGRVAHDTIEMVANDPVLRENQIVLIEAGADGTLLLLTAERGFFQLRADGRIAPLATEINRWIAGKRIFCARRLADGSRVVGFSSVSGDGGMRFNPDGSYGGPLDTSIGLYVDTVRDFFVDREGGLWLGMDTGAARLEWPSGVSIFDNASGLGQGAVVDVVRHAGVLHAGTSEGLFRLAPSDETGRTARFKRIVNQPVSALISHPAGPLVLGYNSLLAPSSTGFFPIARLAGRDGCLLRSTRDPNRVWVGTARGLRAVRHRPQGWTDEGAVDGFVENCSALGESADGALWVATPARGFFRLTFPTEGAVAPRIERFDGGAGLPAQIGATGLTEAGAELFFTIANVPEVFRHDSAAKRFVALPGTAAIGAEKLDEGWTIAGGRGALWLASQAGIHRVPDGGGDAQRLPHKIIATVGAVRRLREEHGPDGPVLWICGDNGLARVELARGFATPVPFAVQLTGKEVREGDELPPTHVPVSFSFVAPRQRPTSPVAYRTRLAGSEDDWTEWSPKRERNFPRLPAGRYQFEVQARDAEGVLGASASLAFAVLPPWWASRWVILGYVALFAGVVVGMVQMRTRTLRLRAARLEGLVAQRTAELAQRNVELVHLHQLELDEKVAARLAEEKARLEVLRYQLNPHFLFNTLASISASLPAERSTARTMVERLAEFCRLTLHRPDEREWTTLGDEVRLLRAYLEIERSRWGELLDVEFAFDPALDGERLPHFLLLPLVENALKYGRATSPDRVGLRLVARRDADGALVLEVANTGEWIEPTAKKTVSSLGIGLENLRERLARYYPRSHHLAITHADGWVTVTLRIEAQPLT